MAWIIRRLLLVAMLSVLGLLPVAAAPFPSGPPGAPGFPTPTPSTSLAISGLLHARQGYTLTATVSQFGTPITGGSVLFRYGNGQSRTVAVDSQGKASLLDNSPAGDYLASAQYNTLSGPSGNLAQISYTIDGLAQLNLDLPSGSTEGEVQTLTAYVDSDATGSIDFAVDGVPVGSATIDSGIASIDVNLAAGTHAVDATYGGEGYYLPDSQSTTLDVGPTPAIALASSANPSPVGDTVTFTASIPSAAVGDVVFRENGTELGRAPWSNGAASLSLANLTAGTHAIEASYRGQVATVVQTVSAPLTLTLASAANPAVAGAAVTFTATLSAPNTGSVSFYDGATLLGQAAIATDSAALTISTLAEGSHTIEARFAGLAASVHQVITPVPTAAATPPPAPATMPSVDIAAVRSSVTQASQSLVQARAALLAGQIDPPGFDGTDPTMTLGGSDNNPVLNFAASSDTLGAAGDAATALASGAVTAPFRVWVDGQLGLHFDDAAHGQFGLVALGADYRVTDSLLLGVALYADYLDNTATLSTSKGRGVLVGPYASFRLGDTYSLDGSVFFGGSSNDVTAMVGADTFGGSFATQRWVAQARFKARWMLDQLTLRADAGVLFANETADAYTTSNGAGASVAVGGFSVGTVQVRAGTVVEQAFALGNGLTLTPQLGVAATLAGNGTPLALDTATGTLTVGAQLAGEQWSLNGAMIGSAATDGQRAISAKLGLSARF